MKTLPKQYKYVWNFPLWYSQCVREIQRNDAKRKLRLNGRVSNRYAKYFAEFNQIVTKICRKAEKSENLRVNKEGCSFSLFSQWAWPLSMENTYEQRNFKHLSLRKWNLVYNWCQRVIFNVIQPFPHATKNYKGKNTNRFFLQMSIQWCMKSRRDASFKSRQS